MPITDYNANQMHAISLRNRLLVDLAKHWAGAQASWAEIALYIPIDLIKAKSISRQANHTSDITMHTVISYKL